VVFMSLNREIGTNHCHRCPGLIARQFQGFFLLFRASGSIYIYTLVRTRNHVRCGYIYLLLMSF
jgi:hypothetical protein